MREDLVLAVRDGNVVLERVVPGASTIIDLSVLELRWLQAVSIPAVLQVAG